MNSRVGLKKWNFLSRRIIAAITAAIRTTIPTGGVNMATAAALENARIPLPIVT